MTLRMNLSPSFGDVYGTHSRKDNAKSLSTREIQAASSGYENIHGNAQKPHQPVHLSPI
jgi:hypothetical protein